MLADGHDCNGILIGAAGAAAGRAEFNASGDVNWRRTMHIASRAPTTTIVSLN